MLLRTNFGSITIHLKTIQCETILSQSGITELALSGKPIIPDAGDLQADIWVTLWEAELARAQSMLPQLPEWLHSAPAHAPCLPTETFDKKCADPKGGRNNASCCSLTKMYNQLI